MSSELINALETIQKEKKISKEEILHVFYMLILKHFL